MREPHEAERCADHASIARILPPQVTSAERREDQPTPLFADESAFIRGAVRERRLEFTTARLCARTALRGLGLEPVPLVPGPDRVPPWPPGVVGSITHCAGYRAAAAARESDIAALGIDAEPHAALPPDVLESVAVGREPDLLRTLADARPAYAWDRVLFSAKESVFKAWYPLTRTWLDFTDCELHIDPEAQAFTADLTGADASVGTPPWPVVSGRWTVACSPGRHHVLTTVCVPTPKSESAVERKASRARTKA